MTVICEYMGSDQLLELYALDLVYYFSFQHQYFQTLIGSYKVTALISDRLLIGASVILVSYPCILSVLSVCFLVGPTHSLVCCGIITSSCCGSLDFCLRIAVCVAGSHISVINPPFLRFCMYTYVLVIVYFVFS